MIEIDHNPHEKRPGNAIWWAAWLIVVLSWIWYFAYREFDKDALALGGFTGMIFTLWSLEMKGDNEVPSWMIPKPRKRHFPPPTPGESATGPNGKALFVVVPFTIAVFAAVIWLRY
jgi:hypothetical protein